MDKYKFNRKRKKLSDKEIEKHKNFKKLRANYDIATKLYKIRLTDRKNKRIFLWVLILALIIYLIFSSREATKNKAPEQDSVKIEKRIQENPN